MKFYKFKVQNYIKKTIFLLNKCYNLKKVKKTN